MQPLAIVVYSLLILAVVFGALGIYLNAAKAVGVAVILLAIAYMLSMGHPR